MAREDSTRYKMPPGVAAKPSGQKKLSVANVAASAQQLRDMGGRLIERR